MSKNLWEHWMVCGRDGFDVYTPVEPQSDGSLQIVYGLALMTDRAGLEDRWGPVKTIMRVDDEYELTNPRAEYDPYGMLSIFPEPPK